ncbi:hypothetical protein LR48_Vigan10g256200, partial [Vigna angularis]
TFSLPTSPKSCIPSRIDPRRILSPGRVSLIDSNLVAATSAPSPSLEPSLPRSLAPVAGDRDVRMSLRGKNGGCMILEVNFEVLCVNSEVFAGLIEDYKKGVASWSGSNKLCRIEVLEVENLGVFRETIELMFENDDCLSKRLLNIGVFGCIDVLEVHISLYFSIYR